jgi:hypothetical protein
VNGPLTIQTTAEVKVAGGRVSVGGSGSGLGDERAATKQLFADLNATP